jgi:hypothetical protein
MDMTVKAAFGCPILIFSKSHGFADSCKSGAAARIKIVVFI